MRPMILPRLDPTLLPLLSPESGLLPNEVEDENPPLSFGSGVPVGEGDIWRERREARRRAISLAAILARFYRSARDPSHTIWPRLTSWILRSSSSSSFVGGYTAFP